MLYGLDLFSGIGGISLALSEWVQTAAYCENDRAAQGVLLSRMAAGQLDFAPIWDDVCTLTGLRLPRLDIISGGFPCQDISVAGLGRGLEGERSGLFFEVLRLVSETEPTFVFLENVPAIRTRGAERVGKELARIGYDCRWHTLSAQAVGAPHRRARWWLLGCRLGAAAYASGVELREQSGRGRRADGSGAALADSSRAALEGLGEGLPRFRCGQRPWRAIDSSECRTTADVADDSSLGRSQGRAQPELFSRRSNPAAGCGSDESGWWAVEPDLVRVAHGIPARVDRLRGLGNAVVPAQAKQAFKELMWGA